MSSTSLLVRPMWMKRESSEFTYSAMQLTKAITSWRVSASISSMRATLKPARALMLAALSLGTRPSSAQASQAAISISIHFW
ncbi:MAG: hypothetical protein BWY87_00751 [Deltaproteobacteria bacterium ADurb.Bin510]|nr:MAG: hypothetical protein BWY87_00751 [Deltaproteobacteria bacterium ADurb.Bin510]